MWAGNVNISLLDSHNVQPGVLVPEGVERVDRDSESENRGQEIPPELLPERTPPLKERFGYYLTTIGGTFCFMSSVIIVIALAGPLPLSLSSRHYIGDLFLAGTFLFLTGILISRLKTRSEK